MAKHTFEIDDDTMDRIIVSELKRFVKYFKNDLKSENPRVFFSDPVKDKEEIKRHIDAFNTVLKYFGK